MTSTTDDLEPVLGAEPGSGAPPRPDPPPPQPPTGPLFILYLGGDAYDKALTDLAFWVHHLLLPTYGREITSSAPWCSMWWEHPEAVAQLYSLWMAWQELTRPEAGGLGPANWHRDYLSAVMTTLRDPGGPFAGCRPGAHRPKETPEVDDLPT